MHLTKRGPNQLNASHPNCRLGYQNLEALENLIILNQRLHKSNFEDAFPKQGRKQALTKYDKPIATPSRVNKTSIRLHN